MSNHFAIVNIIMGVVMVAAFVFGMWRASRRAGAAPRQMRAMQTRAHAITLIAAPAMLAAATFLQNWLIGGCAVVMAGAALIELRRTRKVSETVANWVYDRGRCGKCDYDLTYVDDPSTCPECGWVVPASDTPAERADWAMWWKRWPIDHIENPGRKLAVLVFYAFAFIALAWWGIVYMGQIAMSAMALLMVFQFAVNAYRVAEYMRRGRQ